MIWKNPGQPINHNLPTGYFIPSWALFHSLPSLFHISPAIFHSLPGPFSFPAWVFFISPQPFFIPCLVLFHFSPAIFHWLPISICRNGHGINFLKRKILSDDIASFLDLEPIQVSLISSFLIEINAKYLQKAGNEKISKSKFGLYYWWWLLLHESP